MRIGWKEREPMKESLVVHGDGVDRPGQPAHVARLTLIVP